MEAIQVVLDKKLLQSADRAARRTKQNRSALIREALREHLRNLEVRTLEQRDRDGYSKHVPANDSLPWETEAAWPAEEPGETFVCTSSHCLKKKTGRRAYPR